MVKFHGHFKWSFQITYIMYVLYTSCLYFLQWSKSFYCNYLQFLGYNRRNLQITKTGHSQLDHRGKSESAHVIRICSPYHAPCTREYNTRYSTSSLIYFLIVR